VQQLANKGHRHLRGFSQLLIGPTRSISHGLSHIGCGLLICILHRQNDMIDRAIITSDHVKALGCDNLAESCAAPSHDEESRQLLALAWQRPATQQQPLASGGREQFGRSHRRRRAGGGDDADGRYNFTDWEMRPNPRTYTPSESETSTATAADVLAHALVGPRQRVRRFWKTSPLRPTDR
jgi:hypothetical protein